jgi:CHAT domain-containing protein/Tfp pilus assembly protein PilF
MISEGKYKFRRFRSFEIFERHSSISGDATMNVDKPSQSAFPSHLFESALRSRFASSFYWLHAFLIGLFVLASGSRVQAQEPSTQSFVALEVGKPLEGDLAEAGYKSYRVQLAIGTSAHISVEPKNVDLAIVLLGIDGKEILTVGSAYGPQEPVSMLVMAKETSAYTLKVLATKESMSGGRYKIQLTDIHPSTAQDEGALQAEKLFVQGQDLLNKGTAESRKSAIEQFAQARALWEKAGDIRGEGHALDQLGSLENQLGDNQKAIADLEESLGKFRAVADRRGEAMVLNDIGAVRNDLGDNTKALQCLDDALSTRKALEDRRGEAETLQNIGNVYENLSEYAKSLDAYNAALSIRKAMHDRRGEAQTLSSIGVVYYDLDEDQKALEYYEEALPLQHMLGDGWGQSETLNNMGSAYDTLGEKERALDSFAKSLPLKRATGNRKGEATTLSNMCWLEFTLSEWQEAFDHCTAALEIRHVVGDPQGQAMTLSFMGSLYDAMGERQKALEYLDKALEQARYAGNREWEGLILNNTGVIRYHAGDFREALDYYDKALAIRRSVGDRSGEAATLNNMGRAREALGEKVERVVIVSDGALQYIPFAILSEPNKSADEDNGRSSYLPLIINHEIINLPSALTLAALRRQSQDRQMAPKTVAVIADPVFDRNDPRVWKLPVATPSRQAHRTDDGRLTEQPADSLTEQRIDRSVAEAGFQNGSHIPRLVFSRREAASVLAGVPADQKMEALDFEANKVTAMSETLSQYRIVHLATHGLLNSQHPELSGLVLSLVDKEGRPRDGFLQLPDIYNLKLAADLVVLSACETALGKEVRGEGLLGLTRGFMYAGAPRVVASLWSVDDVATAELMGRFYRAMLAQRMPPSAALRRAQIQMWKEKRWSSPYYWGAFVIEGDWN